MTNLQENPFASPAPLASPRGQHAASEPADWKKIARRWELLRIPYNVLVFLAGMFWIALNPDQLRYWPEIVIFGIAANLAYCIGPLGEMYVHWFCDTFDRRLPAWLTMSLRSPSLTFLLFSLGAAFSVVVTLAAGYLTNETIFIHDTYIVNP
ncbi:MAG: hypothetical protein K1X71_06990 [Pirellulales bacterium]|nr:hypothetical protein [Pirellulales bacterium]